MPASLERFVGREPEGQQLENFITDIASGGRGLMIIEAPSGGGKTIFLAKNKSLFEKANIEIISGQGVQMSAMTPGYILSGLSKYLLNSDEWSASLKEHIQYYFEDIIRIFPAIAMSGHHSVTENESTAQGLNSFALSRIALCLSKIFVMIARENRPIILVLDDFQWADELSKQTLKMWLEIEQRNTHYLGIILCCRKENRDQLDYFRSDLIKEQVEIKPFTHQEALEFLKKVDPSFNDKQAESIVYLTSGNPFAIQFLANNIHSKETEQLQPTATLSATIHRHFEDLSHPQQKLLKLMAVYGKNVDLPTLAAISHFDLKLAQAHMLDSRLEILVNLTGSTFFQVAFNHDKIREAILTLILLDEAILYHSQIADFLESQEPKDLFKLAFHHAKALNAVKALSYSLKAAEEAFSSASYDLAIQNFAIALEFKTTLNQDRANILARLGEAYLLIGKYKQATEVFKEAIRCCNDNILRSEYTGKLGEIEFKQGNIASATELIEQALSLLNMTIPYRKITTVVFLVKEIIVQFKNSIFDQQAHLPTIGHKDALTARLLSRLAYCYWFGKGALYCGWAHLKGFNTVEKFSDSLEKAQAYSEHSPVMTMIPWFERGISYAYQSMKIREKLNSRWGVGQSKGFLGTSLYASSRFHESEQLSSEAFETLLKEGDMWEASLAGWHVAFALYRQGRIKESIQQAQKIFLRGKMLNDNQSAAICLGVIGKASFGKACDIQEIERIEKLQLTDTHAFAELSIAKALYLCQHKKFIDAINIIELAKAKVVNQGLRQEYVATLWPWSATVIRLKIEQSFLSLEESKNCYKIFKKYVRESLWKAYFYRNNLPHALREKSYYLYYTGEKLSAIKNLKKSIEIAQSQKARWEEFTSIQLLKNWLAESPYLDHSDHSYDWESAEEESFILFSEESGRGKQEKPISYYLNQISQIKSHRDGLEKIYQFSSSLASNRRSLGVVEYFYNNSLHDYIPVFESRAQKYKSLLNCFEESLKTNNSHYLYNLDVSTVVILPIRQTNIYGFLYIVCSDQLAYAEISQDIEQIEILIKLITSTIEQRQQNTQMQLLNQDLALRIKSAVAMSERKNAELIEAEKKALQASKAKSNFLANMSHEIRTPLNGVMGTISLLKNTPLQQEQKKYLEALEISSENLFHIVNDILDLSKIESGHQIIQLSQIYMSDIVRQCFDVYKAAADSKNIHLNYDVQQIQDVQVLGDALRIRQVLSNLLTNAIKFTDVGSVSVKVHQNLQDHQIQYRVEVIDTGSGIDESDFDKLFQNFSQLDESPQKKASGTGLGLSICSQLVKLMGGDIGVTSQKGQGSTFWFTLNLQKPLQNSDLKKSDSQKDQNSKDQLLWTQLNVLVAEDNQVNQLIIRKTLESLNCTVTIAENGQQFIDQIKSQSFDIALLDCQMPILDGFEACRRLRAERVLTPPIIALTAYAMEADRDRCLDAGMDDYLTKPVKIETLKSMLEKWSNSNKNLMDNKSSH